MEKKDGNTAATMLHLHLTPRERLPAGRARRAGARGAAAPSADCEPRAPFNGIG